MHSFLTTFLTVASLNFLAIITPGPDFAVVTKNALAYPRHTAILTALGIALGIAVHSTYCILGLAILITQSLWLFNLIKYAGAAYLIYLGVKIWWPTKKAPASDALADGMINTFQITDWQAIKQGLLCNLLNPKATLFTLGLFTLAVNSTTPWWERTFYGLWMTLVTFFWFAFLATVITNPTINRKIWYIQPMLIKIMGGLLIVFGLNLILYTR